MSIETEVLAAADHLVEVFGRHDAEAYFATFAEEATFLFHNHPARLESRHEWRALWDQWVDEGFHVLGCRSSDQRVQVIGYDAAVFSHSVETTARLGEETTTTLERETIVFRRIEGAWLAVHEHLSPAST